MFRKVCLPCDLPQWQEVKNLLSIAKSASTFEAWIHRLQKVYNAVQTSPEGGSGEDNRGAKAKSLNIFQGLFIYLSDYLSAESGQRYLNDLLPFVVERAMQIEAFSAECDFVVPDGDTTIVMTRACACSLLACSLLCILPDRGRPFTFEGLYAEIASSRSSGNALNDFQCQKLHCVFQYYELVSKDVIDSSEEVVFVRQILKNIPTLDVWLNSQRPLCDLEVVTSDVKKVRHSRSGRLILFGEESFGSHVLGRGSEEMESCFIENPELLSAMMFFTGHVENEVITVRGATRFTTFPPRPHVPGTLGAPERMTQPLSSSPYTSGQPTICCSVLPRNSEQPDVQKSFIYQHKAIVKMAGKVLAAFQQLSMDKSRFEEEEEEDEVAAGAIPSNQMEAERDGATSSINEDLPGGMEPPTTSSSYQHHHRNRKSTASGSGSSDSADSNSNAISSSRPLNSSSSSRRTQPWRLQSSASSGGSIDWSRRTMSFELESSNPISSESSIAGGGEEGAGVGSRRRSSGLHSMSRRSSGLSYQLSEEGGAYSRRRSSAMSEASQRSCFSSNSSGSNSSGKRSSTDYSSEMEEYFESFQKRSSIKTSVIEEESGPMDDPTESAILEVGEAGSGDRKRRRRLLQQRSLRKFVGDQPPDAVRPTPIKFLSLDVPMMALDNFTDNLVNQVAQDSREEIARMAAEQQRRRRSRTSDVRVLPVAPKLIRRGRSADLFNFKARESAPSIHPSQELTQLVERYADAISKRIVMEVFSDMSRMAGCPASIPYETPKSLEEFAGDFVKGVFGEAFQVIGRREAPLTGQDQPMRRPDGKSMGRSFFVDERQLNVYSHREKDRMHVCTGSICFEEEEDDDEEEFYSEEVARSTGSNLDVFSSTCVRCSMDHAPLRPRTIGRSLSSGFRDPVLSDFEDLLVNSCINSPGRIMFTSGEGSLSSQVAMATRGEPPSSLAVTVGADLTDLERIRMTSRPRDAEVEATCSRWFNANLSEGRRDDPFDEYAEKFVVEIFRSAICQVLDGWSSTAPPLPAVARRCSSRSATVGDYAVNLVQCIMEEATIELERRTSALPTGMNGGRGLGEAVAAGRAFVSRDGSIQQERSASIQDLNDRVLVGHYRVGVYGNDPEIQALIYWLCASYMGIPSLVYFSHGNVQTDKLSVLAEVVLKRDWSVGALFSELLLWCSTRVDQSHGQVMEGLLEFLLLRRLR